MSRYGIASLLKLTVFGKAIFSLFFVYVPTYSQWCPERLSPFLREIAPTLPLKRRRVVARLNLHTAVKTNIQSFTVSDHDSFLSRRTKPILCIFVVVFPCCQPFEISGLHLSIFFLQRRAQTAGTADGRADGGLALDNM